MDILELLRIHLWVYASMLSDLLRNKEQINTDYMLLIWVRKAQM